MAGRISSLNLEKCLKEHFIDKGVQVINIEELRSNRLFNSTTYFEVQCKNNPKHTYKSCMLKILNKGVDITVCPRCARYNKDQLPVSLFEEYAEKNNLSIEDKRNFYSRWGSSITFICNKCSNKHEIRALSYFEKNTFNELYECQNCKLVKSNIKTDNITIPNLVKYNKEKNKEEFLIFTKSLNPSNDVDTTNKDYGILINKKLAIDYCFSSFTSKELYHQEKLDACASKGIRLITIFDDEWNNKQDICKSRIRNLLGMTTNKIFARKCEVKIIDNSTALQFCSINHIQGKGQSNKAYGLYYNNELISVMTFSLPSASKSGKKKDYDWELNRFCSVLDTVVIGGANKLLNAFRKAHPADKIITFCDLRWGSGAVYEKMDFKFLYRTRPNYYYIGEYTNWERKHRFGFTKKKLISLFNETDISLTEREIAMKNGLFQMYDCGHLKFIM